MKKFRQPALLILAPALLALAWYSLYAYWVEPQRYDDNFSYCSLLGCEATWKHFLMGILALAIPVAAGISLLIIRLRNKE